MNNASLHLKTRWRAAGISFSAASLHVLRGDLVLPLAARRARCTSFLRILPAHTQTHMVAHIRGE